MTTDAIGCQKTITELLIDKKADYLIGLKANQDGLYEQIRDQFERVKPTSPASMSRDLEHGPSQPAAVFAREIVTK